MDSADLHSDEEECPEQIEIEEEEAIKSTLPVKNQRFNQLRKSVANNHSWITTAKRQPAADAPEQLQEAEKPDLPGRVSFSTNVFEIDFSDLSDDPDRPQRAHSAKKVVHFEEEEDTGPTADEQEDSEPSEMDYSQKSDSSSKIIEDYKREIESLNRKHEEELTKLNTEQQGHLFRSNSIHSATDSTKNSVIDNYLETIKETDSLEVFEQIETEILAIESPTPTPKSVLLERSTTTTWDNSQRTDEKAGSSSGSDEKAEEEEIQMSKLAESVKEERSHIKFNVKKSSGPKAPQSRNTIRKSKALPAPPLMQNARLNHPVKQTPPDPKLRKAKSVSSLKDDSHLRDFQMDQVDSWMSMNQEQEMDSMRALMLMKRPQSSHVQYSKEWRDTPSSKTDDEGNFSLEEANDCFSNESTTTYDELVGIIKEINNVQDKKKTDDRKALRADVEFKLKTELTDDDLKEQPPAASDPVK